MPPSGQAPPRSPRPSTGLIVGLVAAAVVLVLCFAGLAGTAFFVLTDSRGDPSGAHPAGTDRTQASESPDGQPSPGSASGDPFAGSLAEDFASGADGITLPDARAVGDFDAQEVEDALAQVRQALIATRMDSTMLHDRDPSAFLDLLAEDNAEHVEDEFASPRFQIFATQLANSATLAVPEPRVDGEVTYEATTDEAGIRVIEVTASFVWAYAFEMTGDDPQLDGIVVVRENSLWHVPHTDDVRAGSRGLWLWDAESYMWGVDCDAADRGLIAPQTEVMFGGSEVDEEDLFDPSAPIDHPSTC